jgi:NADH:ubiquinone oxidoreductase subunit 4 (subunit M)
LGIILGAVYMLYMTARVIFGPLKVPEIAGHGHAGAEHVTHAGHESHPGDINLREISILVPIALAIVILGVKPGVVTDRMLAPVQEIRKPLIDAEQMTMRRAAPNKEMVAQAVHP